MTRFGTVAVLCVVLGCASSSMRDDDGGPIDASRPRDAVVDTPAWDANRDGAVPRDSAVPDAGPCLEGTATPCSCPGAADGFSYCEEGGWSLCECAPPRSDAGVPDSSSPDAGSDASVDAGPCTGDPEWCDGGDNDCDGAIDEGFVCPDSTVHHTTPYDGSVWMLSRVPPPDCQKRLHRLGTRIEDTGLPVNCAAHALTFGTSANAIFHSSLGLIYRVEPGARRVGFDPEVEMPTPPCFDARPFGFDGSDRFYYECEDTLRRDNGEIVASTLDERSLAGVLASGKFIATARTRVGEILLLDDDWSVLSTPTVDDWEGSMERWSAITFGDSALVVFRRIYRGRTRREFVVFRAEGSDPTWRLVRRVPVAGAWSDWRPPVPLPDGRLVVIHTRDHVSEVLEFPVGAAPRILWADGERRAEWLTPGPNTW